MTEAVVYRKMTEAVVFRSVEEWAVEYVSTRVGVEAGTRYPFEGSNVDPVEFVRVQQIGGSGQALVLDRRTLTVECWSETSVAANALVERCYAILRACVRDPEQTFVRGVNVIGGPSFFPDPDTPNPRYQFTLSLIVRGDIINF